MNWLAHVFLSDKSIENQLGNLLADPLKAKPFKGASSEFKEGIELHLIIDSFTDSHPIVKDAKKTLTQRGPLKGVVLDILYDYFLSKHWSRYSNVEREKFLEDFRNQALRAITNYPQEAVDTIMQVVINRHLLSYATLDGVTRALCRIDNRLSQRAKSKECAIEYMPLIEEELDYLENGFLYFFPELMQEVKTNSQHNFRHWRM
jgi:acyl carrier protein phosphodiesterase